MHNDGILDVFENTLIPKLLMTSKIHRYTFFGFLKQLDIYNFNEMTVYSAVYILTKKRFSFIWNSVQVLNINEIKSYQQNLIRHIRFFLIFFFVTKLSK